MAGDYPPQRTEPTNGLGLAGFIVSLVGLISCGLISPVGLIMSLFALRREPKSFAIAGVVLGALGSCGIIMTLLFLPVLFAGLAAAAAAAVGNPAFGTEIKLNIVDAMIEEHHDDTGSFPTALTDLPSIGSGSGLLNDGWKNPVHFQLSPDGQSFVLFSSGPDGVPGTPDDIHSDRSAGPSALPAPTTPSTPTESTPEPSGQSH